MTEPSDIVARLRDPNSGFYEPHRLELADLIERQAAEIERLRGALRDCRQAVSHGKEEPRRNVREIIDEALSGKAAT